MQSPPTQRWCKKNAIDAASNQHIGVSRGGKNTKIHAAVDALGNPVYVQLSAGNIHDVSVAEDVIGHVEIAGSIVMADKAYGSKAFRQSIEGAGGQYCIPPKANESKPWECDWWQYKERHGIECFFQKLKQFRRVATRYDKLATRFLAFIHIACICILLK